MFITSAFSVVRPKGLLFANGTDVCRLPLRLAQAPPLFLNKEYATRCETMIAEKPSGQNEPPTQDPRGSTLLLVGLGNPGPRFDDTRHNIGFALVSAYAVARGNGSFSYDARIRATLSTIQLGTKTVHVVKPETFMNNSGSSVRAALRRWNALPAALLVVTDDVSLDVGRLRLRSRGSSGGHNGLKSIQAALGVPDYPRLKVGVGAPRNSADMPEYVLSKFSRAERKLLQSVELDVFDTIDHWISEPDISRVMNKLGMLQSNSKKR